MSDPPRPHKAPRPASCLHSPSVTLSQLSLASPAGASASGSTRRPRAPVTSPAPAEDREAPELGGSDSPRASPKRFRAASHPLNGRAMVRAQSDVTPALPVTAMHPRSCSDHGDRLALTQHGADEGPEDSEPFRSPCRAPCLAEAAAMFSPSAVAPQPLLPTVGSKHVDLHVVTPDTVRRLLAGEFADLIHEFHIIDCRFAYEFDGGHIRGATNLMEASAVESFLFARPPPAGRVVAVLFHCEFSQQRGPKMLRHVRNIDRQRNQYPALHYPQLYLVDGGYQNVFGACKEVCEPCAYRPMHDAMYRSECSSSMNRVRQSYKARLRGGHDLRRSMDVTMCRRLETEPADLPVPRASSAALGAPRTLLRRQLSAMEDHGRRLFCMTPRPGPRSLFADVDRDEDPQPAPCAAARAHPPQRALALLEDHHDAEEGPASAVSSPSD